MSKNALSIFLIVLLNIGGYKSVPAQGTIGQITLPSTEYRRLPVVSGSFAAWLRHLPLKSKNSPVLDYRGSVFKTANDTVIAAVVDLAVTGRRLEQCMDILVRLYADYLWQSGQTKNLCLPLPGGYRLAWGDWKRGFRPSFKGIDMHLSQSSKADSGEGAYRKYLNTVFAESHTQQFYYGYQPVPPESVAIGDFIVKKGVKGHAVMIVDIAVNREGDLIALIGNGDTPACQFFLINYKKDQAWIPLDFNRTYLLLPLKRRMTWDGLRRFNSLTDSN